MLRRRSSVLWIASGSLGLLLGMGAGQHSLTCAAAADSKPIDVNRISRVTPGMTLADVIREEGPPTGMKNNTYYYNGRGRIVFEGTSTPGDSTKVLKVEEDPTEDGFP